MTKRNYIIQNYKENIKRINKMFKGGKYNYAVSFIHLFNSFYLLIHLNKILVFSLNIDFL